MLKHRLNKIGNALLLAFCLLFVGSLTQSCQDHFDEYEYDDEEPAWLGASIYETLKNATGGHSYSYYTRIIDSLGQKDVLLRTGSRTLFIVDDESFEKFFNAPEADKPAGWKNVSRFEDLTNSQMRIILNSSMLNNAYLLEMMTSLPGSSDPQDSRGECLRRPSLSAGLDSIAFMTAEEMPGNNEYWEHFRQKEGIHVAMDPNGPMLVHFLPDYMSNHNITNEDLKVIFRGTGFDMSVDDASLYQNKILSGGIDYGEYSDDSLTIVCKNGYMYRLGSLLLPPSNMAAELRARGNTKLFSRILDRFSFPVFFGRGYSAFDEKDSVYEIRYLSSFEKRAAYGVNENYTQVLSSSDAKAAKYVLRFDPGHDHFDTDKSSKQADMGAMFVPTDEAMFKYFTGDEDTPGSATGKKLVEQFAKIDVSNITNGDYDALGAALDSIPNSVLVELVNNLMRASFSDYVPSKFNKLVDDGYREMGIKPENVVESVVANNGVIYILNQVFGPAVYESVAAPSTILNNMQIMRMLMNELLYKSYLLAMDANYTFIVPDDEYFVYYDPISTTSNTSKPHAYKLHYSADYPGASSTATAKLWSEEFEYDPKTYEIDFSEPVVKMTDHESNLKSKDETKWIRNRGRELLENLIVVHSDPNAQIDPENGNKYYQTKGYGYIKCNIQDGEIVFRGGEQIDLGKNIVTKERIEYENGETFCTVSSDENYPTGIPTPTKKSVKERLSTQSVFSEFYKLCILPEGYDDLFHKIFADGIQNSTGSDSIPQDSITRYSIFVGGSKQSAPLGETETVQFFSKYHYTIYVPDDNAMKKAYDKGLPDWDAVKTAADAGNTAKAASMIRQINKFLRYHFQDNSLFLDKKQVSTTAGVGEEPNFKPSFETCAINETTGRFLETTVVSSGNSSLKIKDELGNEISVNSDDPNQEGSTWNVMARDIVLPVRIITTPPFFVANDYIETSAFAVIHSVNKVLLSSNVMGYDGFFKRFADDGEPIDTMTVTAESEIYLVASCGLVEINGAYKRIGYLMKENENPSDDIYSKEAYVLTEDNSKMLITNDGFLIKQVSETLNSGMANESTIKYYVFIDDDGKPVTNKNGEALSPYLYKVKKDGKIEKVEHGMPYTSGENQ